MSDVALNTDNADLTLAVAETSAAATDAAAEPVALLEWFLRGVFLLAAVVATGGWIWLLAWIGLTLLGY
jgi:hypothetical protein